MSGEIIGRPTDQFDIDGLLDPQNLPSLLFWLGMLSLGKEPDTLRIPNYAIARQYREATFRLVGTDAGVASVGPIRETLRVVMKDGQGEPFFRLAVDLVLSKLSNRDLLQWGEASVKAILLSFFSLSVDVSVFSEWETNRGYADLLLIPSPHATWLTHAWMVELKYLKKGEDSPSARERALLEGRSQLRRYLADANRMRHLSRHTLDADGHVPGREACDGGRRRAADQGAIGPQGQACLCTPTARSQRRGTARRWRGPAGTPRLELPTRRCGSSGPALRRGSGVPGRAWAAGPGG